MRKDYLTVQDAVQHLALVFEYRTTAVALRNHIQRGNLRTKQYIKRSPHLIRRSDLEEFFKQRRKL